MDNLQNCTYLNPKSKYGNIVLLVPKYLNRNYLLLISSACSLQAYLHDVFSTFQASIFAQICFHSLSLRLDYDDKNKRLKEQTMVFLFHSLVLTKQGVGPCFDILILTQKQVGSHLNQNFTLIPMVPLAQKCQNQP